MQTTTHWTELLNRHFGFSQFRPGQLAALESLDTYGRALAVFPTGAGKSVCYQLPALTYEGLTLVVSPLIALMKDQIDFLRQRGIEAARLDSSLTLEQTREIQDKIRAGTIKLLYVAPERFKNERFLDMIGRQRISLFAVDEAHCISEWGHNFRPDYLKLRDLAKSINAERILTLTATATPAVVKDICRQFDIPEAAAIVTGFFRTNLKLAITPAVAEQRDDLLLKRLKTREPGPTIIYVTLQKTAEDVAERLRNAGIEAEAYHAGMDADERSAVQERWKASDRRAVVATIAFGMGIDKANVRYVYHYNLPKSIENYSQEIGRAGRDGIDSVVEMFACPDDIPVLENFIYGDTPADTAMRSLVEDLMSRDKEFDVSLYELSGRHDVRQLVLKTALTYMELLGAIREGAPYYAGYKYQFKLSPEAIVAKYPGERGEFLQKLFRQGKMGRIWVTLDPEAAAMELGQPRQRIVTALDYLNEQQDIVLQASEVRNRFTRLDGGGSTAALADELVRRFEHREHEEINRIKALLAFIEHDGCHANALAAYFGEIRDERCGNCAQCITGKRPLMPPLKDHPAVLPSTDAQQLNDLRVQHKTALAHPRQVARFLCGLPSPALTKSKLTKHPLYGKLQQCNFSAVMRMAEGH